MKCEICGHKNNDRPHGSYSKQLTKKYVVKGGLKSGGLCNLCMDGAVSVIKDQLAAASGTVKISDVVHAEVGNMVSAETEKEICKVITHG